MNPSDYNNRLSRKERVFKQREQDILDAALNSFCSDHWESVTVSQIADQVGIAKGTMYLHFAGKHEIYARLALDFYQSLLTRLDEPLRGNGISRFRQLVGRAFEVHLQSPVYRRVTQYCEREDFKCSLKPQIAASFDQIDRDIERIVSAVMIQGISEGIFKPIQLDELILGFRCTFHGALTRFWANRNAEQSQPDKFVDSVTSYMLSPIVNQPDTLKMHYKQSTAQLQSTEKDLELNHE